MLVSIRRRKPNLRPAWLQSCTPDDDIWRVNFGGAASGSGTALDADLQKAVPEQLQSR
jgi:hypothetical protein